MKCSAFWRILHGLNIAKRKKRTKTNRMRTEKSIGGIFACAKRPKTTPKENAQQTGELPNHGRNFFEGQQTGQLKTGQTPENGLTVFTEPKTPEAVSKPSQKTEKHESGWGISADFGKKPDAEKAKALGRPFLGRLTAGKPGAAACRKNAFRADARARGMCKNLKAAKRREKLLAVKTGIHLTDRSRHGSSGQNGSHTAKSPLVVRRVFDGPGAARSGFPASEKRKKEKAFPKNKLFGNAFLMPGRQVFPVKSVCGRRTG